METSYNGWPASTSQDAIGVVPLKVAGVEFVGGVRSGDVHTVLGHVAQEFNDRVERLVHPGCWGYAYRQNRNANNLSCHASGTAIDCNAPLHPNGVATSKTYSPAQIAEVHKILAEIPELSEVVHWGGDWTRVPDAMHFEIHDFDTDKLARVAKRIKEPTVEVTKVLEARRLIVQARQLLFEARGNAGPIRAAAINIALPMLKAGLNALPKR